MVESNGDRSSILYLSKNYNTMEWAKHYSDASTGNRQHDAEYKAVFSLLLDNHLLNMDKALDIGCSGGRYSRRLLEEGFDVVGMDIARNPLIYASHELLDAEFVQASITNLSFKLASFDLVICMGVLHHFTNDVIDSILGEISKVIKPDGLFVFDVKNRYNPLVYYLYRKKSSIEFPLTCRTKKEMVSNIERYGFQVIKTKGLFFPIALFAPFEVFVTRKVV